jgi:hypothetical protein
LDQIVTSGTNTIFLLSFIRYHIVKLKPTIRQVTFTVRKADDAPCSPDHSRRRRSGESFKAEYRSEGVQLLGDVLWEYTPEKRSHCTLIGS